uniref:Uncharacterized protein n=1 Tax=Arundo donax TaxID=35708 RepID=A0A0A9CIP8_ARUDO
MQGSMRYCIFSKCFSKSSITNLSKRLIPNPASLHTWLSTIGLNWQSSPTRTACFNQRRRRGINNSHSFT